MSEESRDPGFFGGGRFIWIIIIIIIIICLCPGFFGPFGCKE